MCNFIHKYDFLIFKMYQRLNEPLWTRFQTDSKKYSPIFEQTDPIREIETLMSCKCVSWNFLWVRAVWYAYIFETPDFFLWSDGE